jgi:hypothetical protein
MMKLPQWLTDLDDEHANLMCHAGAALGSLSKELEENLVYWRDEYRNDAKTPAEHAMLDEHIADLQQIIDRINAVFAPWGADPEAARQNDPLRSPPKRTRH